MITKIIFFNSITTYTECQVEAVRQGIKAEEYIVQCCVKNLPQKDYKKPMDLWVACKAAAENLNHNATVAHFIEACCAAELDKANRPELPHKPLIQRINEFLDLNYTARRQ